MCPLRHTFCDIVSLKCNIILFSIFFHVWISESFVTDRMCYSCFLVLNIRHFLGLFVHPMLFENEEFFTIIDSYQSVQKTLFPYLFQTLVSAVIYPVAANLIFFDISHDIHPNYSASHFPDLT